MSASYLSLRVQLSDLLSLATLTTAEREIAIALTRGWSTASVARHRGVSATTVANQIASLFDKLGVHSRTELAGLLAGTMLGRPLVSAAPSRRARGSSSARVLVVEDIASTRAEIVRALEEVGYIVRAVADLATARAALASEPPDVLLSDVRLGSESGIELVAHADDQPTLLMSGAADLDEAIRGLALGAWDFIDKSWGIERIRLAVGEALGGARVRRPIPAAARGSIEIDSSDCAALLIDGKAHFVGAIEHERARHVLLERRDAPPLDARTRFAVGRMLRLAPTKAIGFDLGVSEVTAWTILHDAIEHLGFADRTEAMACLVPLVPFWSDAMPRASEGAARARAQ